MGVHSTSERNKPRLLSNKIIPDEAEKIFVRSSDLDTTSEPDITGTLQFGCSDIGEMKWQPDENAQAFGQTIRPGEIKQIS
jgi:hypothetical protein